MAPFQIAVFGARKQRSIWVQDNDFAFQNARLVILIVGGDTLNIACWSLESLQAPRMGRGTEKNTHGHNDNTLHHVIAPNPRFFCPAPE
jgi:hypothetical protein